jgi:excisionase family DNA binding protein
MAAQPRPDWVTKQFTAEYLRVNPRTVDNMIADGRLKGYRIGRTIRLRLDEIDAAMQPYGGAVV